MMASRSEPEKEMAAIAIDAKASPGLVGMFVMLLIFWVGGAWSQADINFILTTVCGSADGVVVT